jgi:large subunit ribosomal protein L19e
MNLDFQKRLAAKVAGVGLKRIKFNPEFINEIKDAMTREDIKALMAEGAITVLDKKGISRARVKEKKKRGPGSRKGKATARYSRKDRWIDKIRALRFYLQLLRKEQVIDSKLFRKLYSMASGGYFHSKRHLFLYLQSNQLINKENLKKAEELLIKSKELRRKLENKK